MSKARLVLTAIEVEARSPAEVVAAYGVSRSWLYELLARYRAEGERCIRAPLQAPAQFPGGHPRADRRAGATDPQTAQRRGPGRRRPDHRLASDPPPPHDALTGHRPPDPDPFRRRDPRAGQTTQGLVRALSGRDALDPLKDYQPTGRPPGPARKSNARTHNPWVRASAMSCDITVRARQDSNLRPTD